MAVLVIGYLHDQPFADLVDLIVEDKLDNFGHRTEMGPWQKRGFGEFCSGVVHASKEHRTFSCVRLDKDVGALGIATKLGYTSGNSVLVASAIEEQVRLMRRVKRDLTQGYTVFVHESVPMLSEYGNALLVVGRPEVGRLAAAVFGRFVFSETISRKPFVPKSTIDRGSINDISCVEDCHA